MADVDLELVAGKNGVTRLSLMFVGHNNLHSTLAMQSNLNSQSRTTRRFDQRFFFGGAGVAFFLWCVVGIQTWNFTRTANRAEGRIVELRSETTRKTGTMYRAVFEFQDELGQTHSVSDEGKYNPSPYAIGDQISVLYRRGQPQSAKINSFWSVWWLTIVALGIAICFFAAYFIINKKMFAAAKINVPKSLPWNKA